MNWIAYLSTASKWWTIERQKTALASMLPQAKVYADEDDTFRWRDMLVRPTTRKTPASLHVASLAVLSKQMPDFRAFVVRLFERQWEIVVYDGAPLQTLKTAPEAIEAWREARRQSKLFGATRHGGQATKEKFEALLRDKCERYREHWGDPRFETYWILEQVGVSRNTMVKYMGQTRSEAIRENRPRLRAQATRQRRRAAKEQG